MGVETYMSNYVGATQLAQSEPVTTGAVTLYSAAVAVEITRVVIANTGATGRQFRLFHDDDGAVYSTSTALFYDVSVAPNTTIFLDADVLGGGIPVGPTGTIGARSPATAALTFTLYGIPRGSR